MDMKKKKIYEKDLNELEELMNNFKILISQRV